MNRNSLTTAVVAGIAGVAGIANMASAVNLNPDGLGQVLLYPYYTVNAGQQTLLSVVNTTGVGKAVKVRFLEGHNSREVLDFNLFLSKYDVWTGVVFKLSDDGVSGDGAGIFSDDHTCTAPAFGDASNGGGTSAGGHKYQKFFNYAYSGSSSDSGPTGEDRTNEGHFEMISMADIVAGSSLNTKITHVNSTPPGCATAEAAFEAAFPPNNAGVLVAPTSGLFGSASVVNGADGTFYGYNADAIDGFTSTILASTTGSLLPSLAQVNDAGAPLTVTSYVFNDGVLITSPYDQATQGIDAVSSIFEAANIYNEWEATADGAIGSDWVVNFPTKRFYVDPYYVGTTVIAPFEEVFGGLSCGATSCSYTDPDNSCVIVGINIFDREENTTTQSTCGFSPCPPGQPPSSICKETNVITFTASSGDSILASGLTQNIKPLGTAGWLNLNLTGHGHDMRPATNTNVFHGLPVTGFWATDFVVSASGGAALGNYSGVYRHRQSRSCDAGGLACS
jgi:hypothetical protein